jgi:ABC-type multidrug transport system fused ATPase/permease subunit
LDPFERHTSDKLWATLADAKLKEFVESRSGGLDMTIEPNGQNLSVGQRQLVCMVRALLCDCKILLLDEATASVDHHTDRLIQATLRDLKGVTTLTIAHRINTILESDRVLVMDDGKAIEFDNPQALIARPGSVFGDIVAQYQADHDASNSSPRSP